MKLPLWSLVSCAVVMAGPTVANAEWKLPGEFSGNVALTNDYVFRGISQSNEKIAIQGGLDWDTGAGIYLGVWASSVDFIDGDNASVEADIYGGYRGVVGKFSYDVGFIYYAYPGASDALDYDYVEAAFKVGYDFDVAAVSAGVFYSPDNFGSTGDAVYVTSGVEVPIVENLSLSANVAHYTVKPAFGDDYWTWNAGLTYAFPWFDIDVRYVDVDENFCGTLCDARALVSVSRSF